MVNSKIEVYVKHQVIFFETYLYFLMIYYGAKNFKIKNNKNRLLIDLTIEPSKKLKLIKNLYNFYNLFEIKKVITTY